MLRNIILGNKRLQGFWWFLYKVAVKGLNYDRGHVPTANGEPFAVRYVTKRLQGKEIIVFDVGANRGQYLEMFEKNTRSPFRMYCFEPQQDAFQFLTKIAAGRERERFERSRLVHQARSDLDTFHRDQAKPKCRSQACWLFQTERALYGPRRFQ